MDSFKPNIILAKAYYKGGKVKDKGKPIGTDMLIHYKVKDVDSVPALLAPKEYVLTEAMQKRINKVYKQAGKKSFLL